MYDGSMNPAELTVSSLYVLPQGARSSDSLQLGAEARNDGGSESGPFKVRLFLDTGEYQDIDWPSLAPGQSQWREWEHAPLAAGNHTLSVQLDVDSQVQEGNKSDNQASIPFQVADAPGSMRVETFEPEEVTGYATHEGKSNSAATEVDWILNRFINYIDRYWHNYEQGITLFTNQMQFPAEEEANADSLQAALVAGANSLFVSCLKYVVDDVGLGPVVDAVNEGAKAYFESEEKKAKAAGQIKVHRYITDLITGVQAQADPMKARVEQARPKLTDMLDEKIKAADKIAKGQGDKTSAETGDFVGEAAQMILDMKQHATAFEQSTPRAEDFLEQFTLRFVRSQDDGKFVRKTYGPSRTAGTFRMKVKFTDDDGTWVLDDVPDQWTFLTSIQKDEAAKIADELQDLVGKGQMPYQLLETIIMMSFDDQHVLVNLKDSPLDFYLSNASDGKVAEIAEATWKTEAVRNRVFGIKRVEAGDDW